MWNLVHVTLLAPGIFRWLQDIWNISFIHVLILVPLMLKYDICNWKSKRTITSDLLFENHFRESSSCKLNTHVYSHFVSFVPAVKELIELVFPFGA